MSRSKTRASRKAADCSRNWVGGLKSSHEENTRLRWLLGELYENLEKQILPENGEPSARFIRFSCNRIKQVQEEKATVRSHL